ncbi:MAG: PspA-associated protein PspAB [Acidothermaceae bacterium]
MGFLDSLLGRTKPVKANLDDLFALPSAAITMQAGLGFTSSGLGSVCYKPAEGAAFARTQADVQQLLDADQGPKVELSADKFGFTWLLVRHDPADVPGLVTDLHAVNSSLQDAGFGPALLCSLVSFLHPDGRRVALVYLYKRGTFYPFAPIPGGDQRRDNALEIQIQGALADDMKVEPELNRWFPVWGAPGL